MNDNGGRDKMRVVMPRARPRCSGMTESEGKGGERRVARDSSQQAALQFRSKYRDSMEDTNYEKRELRILFFCSLEAGSCARDEKSLGLAYRIAPHLVLAISVQAACWRVAVDELPLFKLSISCL